MHKEVTHAFKWHDEKVTHVVCIKCKRLKESLLFKRRESAAQLKARGYSGRHQILFMSSTCNACWKARPRRATVDSTAKAREREQHRARRDEFNTRYLSLRKLAGRLRSRIAYFKPDLKYSGVVRYLQRYLELLGLVVLKLRGRDVPVADLPTKWQDELSDAEREELHALFRVARGQYAALADSMPSWAVATAAREGIELDISPKHQRIVKDERIAPNSTSVHRASKRVEHDPRTSALAQVDLTIALARKATGHGDPRKRAYASAQAQIYERVRRVLETIPVLPLTGTDLITADEWALLKDLL